MRIKTARTWCIATGLFYSKPVRIKISVTYWLLHPEIPLPETDIRVNDVNVLSIALRQPRLHLVHVKLRSSGVQP